MNEELQMIQIPGTGQEENAIYAKHHTLFWKDEPHQMKPVEDGNGGIVPGLYEEQPGYRLYKLFIGEFDDPGSGVHRIINKLQESDPEDMLEIHISSPGGSVEEFFEFYNLCNAYFHGKVATFVNYGYSGGAWMFLAGVDRVIYPNSDIMFHSFSGGAFGKRDDLLTHLEHTDKRITGILSKHLEPYLTKKEIKKLNKGKDFWMDADEMIKRGIATHIIVDGEVVEAKEYQERGKKKK